jgi:hypothetical protein
MAEREVLQNAIGIGFVHKSGRSQAPAAFGTFAGEQMALAGAGAQHLARSGDFEPFRHRFPCFNTFGTSHKIKEFLSKERAI